VRVYTGGGDLSFWALKEKKGRGEKNAETFQRASQKGALGEVKEDWMKSKKGKQI